MTGYIRKDTTNNIADGNVINATDLDNEFDGVQAAFVVATGHTHDGTASEGAAITKIGPVQDVVVSIASMSPKTTNTIDLGTSSLKYKDAFFAGNETVGGTLAVTGVVTLTAQPVLSSLTASSAVATDASKGLVSVTNTGTGNNVLATSPTLVTPILGTPQSATLTNATGLPISTGVVGLGTGVATALAVNVGSAGSPVVNGGVLGTPSSGTVTNLTGTASININGTVGATTANTGAFTTLTTSSTVTLNSGTANGVAYLNGSKVLTTGSALVFDGTNFGIGGTAIQKLSVFGTVSNFHLNPDSAGNVYGYAYNDAGAAYTALRWDAVYHAFLASGTEAMRLTSSGLEVKQSQLIGYSSYSGIGTNGLAVAGNVGIGTSSPAAKLTVVGPMWVPASPFKSVVDLYSTDAQAADVGAGITLGGVYDSSNNRTTFAQIAGIKENATSGNFAGALALYTRVNGAGLVERMRLDSSGNLGLGVTPSAQLAAYKSFQFGIGGNLIGRSDNAGIELSSNSSRNTAGTYIYLNTDGAAAYRQYNGAHEWYNAVSGTAGNAITFTQAMTLNASGNLLVGTTALPSGTSTSGFAISMDNVRGQIQQRNTGADTVYIQAYYNSNGLAGSITTGGSATSYNTSSDYRLKNITGPVTTSGAYIDSLKPVEGTWKADGSTFVGLIAHETQEASRTTVATGTKDGEQMQGMDYSSAEIIANLIAELQSLRARVAQLESK